MARSKSSTPRRRKDGISASIMKPSNSSNPRDRNANLLRNPLRATSAGASKPRPAANADTHVASALPTHVFTCSLTSGVARGEVLRMSPSAMHFVQSEPQPPSQHMHVFFFPGNPGIIEFYRRWLYDVSERLAHDVRHSTTLHALGLPGHDVRELNGARQFSMAEHVEYVRKYLHSPMQVSPNTLPLSSASNPPDAGAPRAVFIGHSYGAFLALRVLNAEPALARFAHLIMLMPAVWEMGACRPAPVRVLTHERLARSVFIPLTAALTGALPRAMVRAVVARVTERFEHGSARVLGRMFDGRRTALYANVLALAAEEAREIRHPRDEKATGWVGADRARLYWTDNDPWCDEQGVAAIREAFGELTVVHAAKEHKIPHGFSTSIESLGPVARVVSAWLTEISRDRQ